VRNESSRTDDRDAAAKAKYRIKQRIFFFYPQADYREVGLWETSTAPFARFIRKKIRDHNAPRWLFF
jgi:hypothetical protein